MRIYLNKNKSQLCYPMTSFSELEEIGNTSNYSEGILIKYKGELYKSKLIYDINKNETYIII